MLKSIEVSGKTVEEAVAKALGQLGLERDEVSVEILEREKRGFLGIGAVQAQIRVSYEAPDEKPVKAAPKKAEAPRKAPAPKAEAPKAEPKKPAPKTRRLAEGEQAAATEDFLKGLLERMGVQADMEISPRQGGGLNVNLSGSGIGAVIGRRGETLDAIQHLTNYAVNRGNDKRSHINVDAENYRAKREDSLVHLAEKMAAKAIKYKRSMALEPMNSYERHIIHTALQEYEGVTTSSTGSEPNRRVVVNYVRTEADNEPAPAPKAKPAPKVAPAPAAPAANVATSTDFKEWC